MSRQEFNSEIFLCMVSLPANFVDNKENEMEESLFEDKSRLFKLP